MLSNAASTRSPYFARAHIVLLANGVSRTRKVTVTLKLTTAIWRLRGQRSNLSRYCP